jgi:hypothetical protein
MAEASGRYQVSKYFNVGEGTDYTLSSTHPELRNYVKFEAGDSLQIHISNDNNSKMTLVLYAIPHDSQIYANKTKIDMPWQIPSDATGCLLSITNNGPTNATISILIEEVESVGETTLTIIIILILILITVIVIAILILVGRKRKSPPLFILECTLFSELSEKRFRCFRGEEESMG